MTIQPSSADGAAARATTGSRWERGIRTLVDKLRKIEAGTGSSKALAGCRERFYRLFWELSRVKAGALLWCRGLGGGSGHDAEDAASAATNNLLRQEQEMTGVFGLGSLQDRDLCAYLSVTICRGAQQRVGEVLASHRRARGVRPASFEELERISDPSQDFLRWQQRCMDLRDVSAAIAPKYRARLPRAGKTPPGEVLVDICLGRKDENLARRTGQRLRKDIRDDLISMLGG